MSNNNKVILITGANKGIGFEAARQLGGEGHTIIIGARNPSRGAEATNALKDQGHKVTFVELDVTSETSIRSAFEEVSSRFDHLDVLVNNAGVITESWGSPISLLSVDNLHECLNTNLDGVIRVTNAFIPLLKKASKARIINVSSTWGSINALAKIGGTVPSYHISKAALNAYTVLLAHELKSSDISVNVICPGWVKTDMGTENAPRSVEQGAAIITKLATQDADVTGGFFDDNGVVAW